MQFSILRSACLSVSLALLTAGAVQAAEVSSTADVSFAFEKAQIASDASIQSNRIGLFAAAAIQGHEDAFVQLRESRAQLVQDLDLLTSGGQYRGRLLPAASPSEQANLAVAKRSLQDAVQAVSFIVDHKQDVDAYHATTNYLNDLAPVQLDRSEQVSALYSANGSRREVYMAGQLSLLSEKLARNVNLILSGDEYNPEVGFQLAKDAAAFEHINDGLLNGNSVLHLTAVKDKDTRSKLVDLRSSFGNYNTGVQTILHGVGTLAELKASAASITNENVVLCYTMAALKELYMSQTDIH